MENKKIEKTLKKVAVEKLFEIQKNYEAKPLSKKTVAMRVFFDANHDAFRLIGRAHDYSVSTSNL